MHLFSALIIGIAANLDNFGIGVSYGIQKIRIPLLSNFLIALLSGILVALSVSMGHIISHFVGLANIFGALLIITIGVWVSLHKAPIEFDALPVSVPCTKTYSVPLKPLKCVVQITKNPSAADVDANAFFSLKEAVVLGMTLSFNCITTGVGAGLTSVSPFTVALPVFLFSMITISVGYWTGWRTAFNRLDIGLKGFPGYCLF